MKLISIIMPYFKKQKYLKQSVNSILSQSYENFEIIIIDDELSLESKSVLSKISKLDKRIKVISNPFNLGAGLARNNGIKIAKGEFIAFCDCDDLWSENKLKLQLEFMNKNNYEFSFTSYEIINDFGKKIGERLAKNIITFNDLIKSCDIGLSTVVIKKELFKNKNFCFPNLKTKEDYVLWLKFAKQGVNIFGLNNKLSVWRKSENSLSSSIFQKLLDGYRVYYIYLGYGVIKSLISLLILSLNYMRKRN